MGADVADSATAALRRIGAPGRLLLAGLLEPRGQPVLRVLDLHHAQLAELARLDPRARLAHHRMAGVVVGQAEHEAGAAHGPHEVERVVERGGQRLVADDVDAGLEEGLGGRVMDVVRRDDRHDVDAVVARGLLRRHLREAAIGALRRDPKLCRRGPGARRIGAQRARDQLVAVVQACGDPMHRTDEGALAAAHHAKAQPAPGVVVPALDRHACLPRSMPSMRRLAASSAPPAAKSSNAVSVTWMMCSAMKGAPSAAPCSGCFRQHSHSSTAQLS